MSNYYRLRRASGFRLAGYFTLVVVLLSSFPWISVIYHDYVMEHRWPSASGLITARRENSREVQPASSRQRRYWVYWAEFDVALALPPDRCPGDVTVSGTQPAQCSATVASPHTRSRANAIQWLNHHPLDSTMIVHYDLATRGVFAGGESIIDLYPWYDMGMTATITMFAAALLFLGRKQSGVSDAKPSADPGTTLSI